MDGSFIGNQSLTDIRPVVVGQPYFLNCPKHSYTRGCNYNWGRHRDSQGLAHIKDDEHRVLLPNGTLFFSAITRTDIDDFGAKNGGHGCIIDCYFSGFHGMATSHKINFNETGGKHGILIF